MKNYKTLTTFLVALAATFIAGTASAAIPPSSFYAGLSFENRSFNLQVKGGGQTNVQDYGFKATTNSLHLGFRGSFTRIYFEYTPEKTFTSDDTTSELKQSSWALNGGVYKSIDLFYFGADLFYEQIELSFADSSTELPEGANTGLRIGAGAFIGPVSIEYSLSSVLSDKVKGDYILQNQSKSAITVAGHF